MDLNKFWGTRSKICSSYNGCHDGCPLYSRDSHPSCLGSLSQIGKGTPIMEQWLAGRSEPVEKPRLDAEALAEFAEQYNEMCRTFNDCKGCPLDGQSTLCPDVSVRPAHEWAPIIAAVEEWHNNRSKQIDSIDLLKRFTETFMEEFDLIPSEARKMASFIAENEHLKQYYTMCIQEENK